MVENDHIDGELLTKAIDNVAKEMFYRELRQAVAFGPKIFGDIFNEYDKLRLKDLDNQINITE